jgi:hypothetical protein
MVTALGFQLPLSRSLLVQGAALAASLATNNQRCATERHIPHFQELYQAIFDKAGLLFSKVVPISIARRRDCFSAAAPCMLVQAWGQIVLGYLLPALIMDWSEMHRRALEQLEDGRRPLRPNLRSGRAVLSYLGLFVVASALCWRGLEVVFWLQQGYRA